MKDAAAGVGGPAAGASAALHTGRAAAMALEGPSEAALFPLGQEEGRGEERTAAADREGGEVCCEHASRKCGGPAGYPLCNDPVRVCVQGERLRHTHAHALSVRKVYALGPHTETRDHSFESTSLRQLKWWYTCQEGSEP